MNYKILLVEDERDINLLWSRALIKEGYQVDSAFDGKEATKLLKINTYDIAILDVMLPYKNGLEITSALKKTNEGTYVILITSKTTDEDIEIGLSVGADDYLKKPCSSAELKSRIKKIISKSKKPNEMQFNDILADSEEHFLLINNKKYFLSPTEFKICLYLLRNGDKNISKSDIIQKVWGLTFNKESRLFELNIFRIRKKINKDFIKCSKYKGYFINHE